MGFADPTFAYSPYCAGEFSLPLYSYILKGLRDRALLSCIDTSVIIEAVLIDLQTQKGE